MSLTILPELEQGTEAWHDQRRGILTASVIGRLISIDAPDATAVACSDCDAEAGGPCLGKGKKDPAPIKTLHSVRKATAAFLPPTYSVADTETSRGLVTTLIAEKISGFTEPSYMNADMTRGVMSEPFARDLYAEHFAKEPLTEVGFMRRTEATWALGYSPDGLVGDDGLIEIKAPRAKSHLATILADQVPAHYMAQCQSGLLVSGRKWIDFVSYVGGMPLYVKRVYPDPQWARVLTAACVAYEEQVLAVTAEYLARTADLPMTERINFDELELVF